MMLKLSSTPLAHMAVYETFKMKPQFLTPGASELGANPDPLSGHHFCARLLERLPMRMDFGLPSGGTAVRSHFCHHVGPDIYQQIAKMAPAPVPASDVQQMQL